MIIKKLNTMFHKHSRVLFGLFTLIIIVSFMGFLTPGQFGCDTDPGSQVVGEVYGKKVSVDDLREFYRVCPMTRQKSNVDFKDIFDWYCLNFRADQLGIHVSDDEVAGVIRPMCIGKDGKYDEQGYRKLIGRLNRQGISEKDFVESIRVELKFRKLEEHVVSQVEVTPSEVESLYREVKTKLHFKVAAFNTAGFVPDEKALKEFFGKNKDRYRCAKFAVFPVGKDLKAAEKQAYDFLNEVKQNAASFDQIAKKLHVKVLPEQWMTLSGRPEDYAKLQLTEAIFAADANHPVTEVVAGSDMLYVGCFVAKSDEEKFAGIKAQLEEQWRLEAAMKTAESESRRLNAIPDPALREKAFLALKNVKIADETQEGGVGIRDGETMAVGSRVYLLKKRESPSGAVPEAQKKMYRDICRGIKGQAAWRGFLEDLMGNCKFFMKTEGRR